MKPSHKKKNERQASAWSVIVWEISSWKAVVACKHNISHTPAHTDSDIFWFISPWLFNWGGNTTQSVNPGDYQQYTTFSQSYDSYDLRAFDSNKESLLILLLNQY